MLRIFELIIEGTVLNKNGNKKSSSHNQPTPRNECGRSKDDGSKNVIFYYSTRLPCVNKPDEAVNKYVNIDVGTVIDLSIGLHELV